MIHKHILPRAGRITLAGALPHELTHLVMGRHLGPTYANDGKLLDPPTPKESGLASIDAFGGIVVLASTVFYFCYAKPEVPTIYIAAMVLAFAGLMKLVLRS